MKAVKLWLTYRQLNSNKPKRICKAAKRLGQLKQRKAVLPLATLLEHEDPSVRGAAANALGEIGDQQAITPLVVALHESHQDCRKSLQLAIRTFGKAAVPQLLAMTRGDDDRLRQGVIQTLGLMHDASTVDTLIETLRDRAAGVRQAAAEALGQVRDERAVMPLLMILQDDNPHCRAAAQKALVEYGSLASPHLVSLLRHQNEVLRENAIQTLGEMRDYSGLGPLTELVEDPSPVIRKAALVALGKIGEISVIPRLRAHLEDEDRDFRMAAFGVLEELAHAAVSQRDWTCAVNCRGAAVRPIFEEVFRQLNSLQEQGGHDPGGLLWVADALSATIAIGDIKAVPFLLKLLREPAVSEVTLVALEKWLKASASDFTDEQLRKIGTLDDIVAMDRRGDRVAQVAHKKCDCSAINELAQRELRARRTPADKTAQSTAGPIAPQPSPAFPPTTTSPDSVSARKKNQRLFFHKNFQVNLPADARKCNLCQRPTYVAGDPEANFFVSDNRLDDAAFIRRAKKTFYMLERFDCPNCGKLFCWECAIKFVHESGAPSPGKGLEWCPSCAAKVNANPAHRGKSLGVLSKEQRNAVVSCLLDASIDHTTADEVAFQVGKLLVSQGWDGVDAYFGRLFAVEKAKRVSGPIGEN